MTLANYYFRNIWIQIWEQSHKVCVFPLNFSCRLQRNHISQLLEILNRPSPSFAYYYSLSDFYKIRLNAEFEARKVNHVSVSAVQKMYQTANVNMQCVPRRCHECVSSKRPIVDELLSKPFATRCMEEKLLIARMDVPQSKLETLKTTCVRKGKLITRNFNIAAYT